MLLSFSQSLYIYLLTLSTHWHDIEFVFFSDHHPYSSSSSSSSHGLPHWWPLFCLFLFALVFASFKSFLSAAIVFCWNITAWHCAGTMTFISWRSQACWSTHTVRRRPVGSCCILRVHAPSTKSILSSSHFSSRSECSFCSRIVALCSRSVALLQSHLDSRSQLHSRSNWLLVKLALISCKWVLSCWINWLTSTCWTSVPVT